MAFLYEKLDNIREFGSIKPMPSYIANGINQSFVLRPYQIAAFENYVTWFESNQRPFPIQNLFHMATGSGKTLIMAGLMLYLYKKGYRNFLFFVNLSNIVNKTKENFLNSQSSKYLFADEIRIDGEKVVVKEVTNFQYSDDNAINICFTTTQGLHSDIWLTRENGISIDDFQDKKVVLISDEAHHLNVDTRRMNAEESTNYHSWEHTVRTIFGACRDNVLLEFTATCDVNNPNIKAEYENKIIFDYQLRKFCEDRYSKEIKTLRCDIDRMDRCIQAIILSQYRMKVFQDHRLAIKPVVLFKASKIDESKTFMQQFIDVVSRLNGTDIERISNIPNDEKETMSRVFAYFAQNGISFDQLAQELREDFSAEHCISANDETEAEAKQIALNSLEDTHNPYRAIFEVKKLDEGWDVLNLFDIVRLYETRQSSGNRLSSSTVSEAQLIGRGARYCPFQLDAEQEKYRRKYDGDLDHPLRICEELYYHCQNDSRYIGELKRALRESGIDLDEQVVRNYVLKPAFKQDTLYTDGFVFMNERKLKDRNDVHGILPFVREKLYTVSFSTGSSGEDTMLGTNGLSEHEVAAYPYTKTIGEIAAINYAIVYKALCKYSVFKFNILKSYFPNLKSTREFVEDEAYLGKIKIQITSKYQIPPPQLLLSACVNVLGRISEHLSSIEETYEGTKIFKAHRLSDVIKDKRCNYTNPHDGGVGVSQNDASVPRAWKIDLSRSECDWFAFEDNFGTSEEKAFVAYFRNYVDALRAKYDKVYLVRNERQLKLYSFEDGERFEPDYILFLHSRKEEGYEQLQVFIEPKGDHLIAEDKWKEDFLLQLEAQAIPTVKFVDDNKYKIWGFHFFNQNARMNEFQSDMERL